MPSTGGNLGSVSRWCSSTKSDLYTVNMICNSKSCFSVGKVNKIGLTFVSTEQHSENMAIQRLSKLLLHQLYFCSSVSVVMEVLLFASQGKNEYRKVSEEELILQARNKFWCLGFIQTLKSYIPCSLNLGKKSQSWWNIIPVLSMSAFEKGSPIFWGWEHSVMFHRDPWNFTLSPCHHPSDVNTGVAGEFKLPFHKNVGFQSSLKMTWEISLSSEL